MSSHATRDWFLRNRGLIGTLAFVVTAIFVAAIFSFAPRTVDPRDRYSTFSAQSEGFAVWYELLRREGLPVERFERHIVHLDDATAVLIVASPEGASRRGMQSGESLDAEHLSRWIRGGGTLVVLSSRCRVAAACDDDPRRMPVIERRPDGRGMVVGVDDSRPLTDAGIGLGDNARLAMELVRPRRSGVIAFDERPHGYAVADHWWQAAPGPVVAAALFAACATMLWLCGAAWRFGPVVHSHVVREDGSQRYVSAVAALLARGPLTQAGKVHVT